MLTGLLSMGRVRIWPIKVLFDWPPITAGQGLLIKYYRDPSICLPGRWGDEWSVADMTWEQKCKLHGFWIGILIVIIINFLTLNGKNNIVLVQL